MDDEVTLNGPRHYFTTQQAQRQSPRANSGRATVLQASMLPLLRETRSLWTRLWVVHMRSEMVGSLWELTSSNTASYISYGVWVNSVLLKDFSCSDAEEGDHSFTDQAMARLSFCKIGRRWDHGDVLYCGGH